MPSAWLLVSDVMLRSTLELGAHFKHDLSKAACVSRGLVASTSAAMQLSEHQQGGLPALPAASHAPPA